MAYKMSENISGTYLQVLKLVKSGITIQDACVMAGIDRKKFYKRITKEQKKELRFYKSTMLIDEFASHFKNINFQTLEIDDYNIYSDGI